MPPIVIQNELNKLTVLPESGQILQWIFNGRSIFYKGSSPRRSGVPILFPFANPLKDGIFELSGKEIPQHGFARDFSFKSQTTADSILLTQTNDDISEQMQEAFPFKYELELKFSIEIQKLFYQITVRNLDDKQIAIAPGVHPYFPILHETKKDLLISNLEGFDTEKINFKKFSKEIFYNFSDSILITFPGGKLLEISEESNPKQFQNLVLWTQNPGQKDCNFVCLELFTKQTNGINENPILIQPGQSWSTRLCFTAF
jgi:galactose mutarotase-like enzyme